MRVQAVDRVRNGIRERLTLRPIGSEFRASVPLARALIRRGVTGSVARYVAEQLLEGRAASVLVPNFDGEVLAGELQALGVLFVRPQPASGTALASVRNRLQLSQEQFANSVGLELRTLQNWEQERGGFDAPTALLIKVLERYPDLVQRVASEDPLPTVVE